jgi:hypothetical protein
MSVEKQIVDVLLNRGLETRQDGRLFLPGELSILKNFVASKDGILNRAPGGVGPDTAYLEGWADVGGILPVGDQLLAIPGPKAGVAVPPAVYLSNSDTWTDLLPSTTRYSPALLTRTPTIRNGRTQNAADVGTLGGETVIAWVEASGSTKAGLHIGIFDAPTGAPIEADLYLSATAYPVAPRVVATATNVLVLYADAGNLKCYIALGAGAGATTTLRTDITGELDAVWTGTFAAIAYKSGASQFTLVNVTSAGAVSGSPTVVAVANDSIGIGYSAFGGTPYLCVAYYDGGTPKNVVARWFSTSLVQTAGPTTVDAGRGQGSVIAFTRDATSAAMRLIYAVNFITGSVTISGTAGAILNATGVTSTTTIIRDVLPMSAPVFIGSASNPDVVFLGIGPSTANAILQTTGVVVSWIGAVRARVLPGLMSQLYSQGRVANVLSASGIVTFLAAEFGAITYQSNYGAVSAYSTAGISRIAFEPAALTKVDTVSIGGETFIAGAAPQLYDGAAITEVGFHFFPQGLTNPATGAGAGSLSAGSYQYRAHYEWTDRQGRVHRSAPSPALTVVAALNDSRTIRVPTLRVTAKLDQTSHMPVSPPTIVLSRTEANGTVFYRVSSVSSPTFNDPTVNYVDLVDTLADSALIANQLLYTTGNILDGIAPPACRYACVHQSRIVIAGLENPYEWRYSTPVVDGEYPRFNELLSGRVPEATGKITALAAFDEQLVVLTERAVYRVPGEGADNRGLNATFPEPIHVTTDVGCADSRSVVEIPAGLAFLTQKGMRLLAHGFSMHPTWGTDVDGYAGYTFFSAVNVTDKNQARWQATSVADPSLDPTNGITLVYDTLFDQWAVWDTAGIDACMWNGLYTRLRADAQIRQDVTFTYLDGGSMAPGVVETGWLKLGALQGFQRVWRVLIDGTHYGAAAVTLEVGYDFKPAYDAADSFTFDSTALFAAGDPFQIRRHLRVQKCRAIRFRLTISPAAPPYQGISIAAVSLEAGLKRGATKNLPSTKTF